MIPPPIALGLALCDYVIVEERTKKVSLIGRFDTFFCTSVSGKRAAIFCLCIVHRWLG
jgi:hypothetical protein